MRMFKVAWNLLVGVVTLSPSPFFTHHHRDHHNCKYYGTHKDPEYVVNFLPDDGGWRAMRYAVEIAVFPLLVFVRFLLCAAHVCVSPLARVRAASRLRVTLNWRYERKMNAFDRRMVTIVELLCSFRAAMMLIPVFLGWTHWTRLPLLYAA